MLLSVLISLAAIVAISGQPLAAQDTTHRDTTGKKQHSVIVNSQHTVQKAATDTKTAGAKGGTYTKTEAGKLGNDAKTTTGTAVTHAKSGLAEAGVDTKTVTKGGVQTSSKTNSKLNTAFDNAKAGLSQAGIGGGKTVTTKSGGSTKPKKPASADSSHTGKQ
jgi:hypothetical protein